MNLDLHKLEIFVTVARLASFTKAADYLHMTQPTVSQQLAILEIQIGTQLIERDTRRQRLTAAGETLLPYAEKLLADAKEAIEATRIAAGLADRTLRLGAGSILASYLAPRLLSAYRTRFPDHIVRISVGNTSELLAWVASEAVEVALVGLPADHPDVVVTPFMQDRLVVIVGPHDVWANRSEVELEELRYRTLLTRETGSAVYRSIERLLGPAALSGDSVIMLGETEAIKRSVEVGLGIALIQEIAVEREVAAGHLISLRLRGADDSRIYSYAHLRRHKLLPAAQTLVALLEDGAWLKDIVQVTGETPVTRGSVFPASIEKSQN